MVLIQKVIIVTDGACLGNPGPGGWAALLQMNPHEKMISGSQKDTTNNQMELKAVIEGLKALKKPCQAHIISDSKYVIQAFTKGWLNSWQRNNWKNAKKQPVKNKELWLELLGQSEIHQLTWEWVKGHSGHPENERVDQKAREEAENAG